MAPSKEAETTVVTATAAATADPLSKSPNETPTRPQPVALEVPVTINGAHTVAGSDKREPFSETTNTVLVFGHGAVVRVNTALAAGQLVFLTNEKSKKEVVCQVVKSKSGGSGGYVELQFTEPAPGFWGLRMPAAPMGSSPAPTATPRPASTIPPISAAPKPTAPVLPAIPKPEPVPVKPAAATITPPIVLPPKPTVAPPVPPKAPAPAVTQTLAPALFPPAPVPPSVAPPAPVPSATAAAPEKPASVPPPPLRDYAKEIEALFASSGSRPAPAALPAAEPKAASPASTPSSEQLKLEAARLQAQLSSMLFSETPAPSQAPPAPPTVLKPEPLASDVGKKVIEIAHHEPKPAVLPERKAPPVAPLKVAPLPAQDQEVKIPSWLAPLSHSSEPAVAGHSSSQTAPATEISALTEESPEATFDSAGAARRSESVVLGGPLLGESVPESTAATAPRSKKGLWIGLAAAAVVLLAVGAVWYLRPGLFSSSPVVSAKTNSSAVSSPSLTHPSAEVKPGGVNPSNENPVNTTVASSAPRQPAKTSEPAPVPSAPARETRSSNSESKNSAPASRVVSTSETSKKPAVGELHLAAPVVSRGTSAQQTSDLPAIDVSSGNSGAEALAGVGATRNNAPSAPVPVGGEVKSAQLLKSVPPVYPPMARAQHISGNVQIDALIDASGNVAELKVISGPPLLQRAALDAVKQWKYKPAQLDGQPTSMHLTVSVQFRAQ